MNLLQRKITDRVLAIIGLIVVLVILYFEWDTDSTIALLVLGFILTLAIANALFIVATPIAMVKEGKLFLYSENQPILYDVRPKVIEIDKIRKIKYTKNYFESRMLFVLPHNTEIVHAFPSVNVKRAERFANYLKASVGNIEIEGL